MLMTYVSCFIVSEKNRECSFKWKDGQNVFMLNKRKKLNDTVYMIYIEAVPLMVLLLIISFNQIEMTFWWYLCGD